MPGHNGWVLGLDLAADGHTAVSAGADGQVLVWDTVSRQVQHRIARFADAQPRPTSSRPLIPEQGTSPTVVNERMASSSRPLIPEQGTSATVADDINEAMGSSLDGVAVDPTGRYVAAVGTYGGVWLWDLSAGTEHPVASLLISAASADFEPGGRRLALGTADGIVLWDWASGQPAVTLPTGSDLGAVRWAPQGRLLAVGRPDGRILLVDAGSQSTVRELDGHVGQVWKVAFSPDGRFLASAGQDRTARLWDLQTGRETARLLGHDIRLSAIAFSPRGDVVVTGDVGGFVGVWDATDGVNLSLTRVHGQSVNELVVTGDGTIASASDDWAVRLTTCGSCGPVDTVATQLRARLALVAPADARPKPA
jgi:WD40 repeat protein